MKPRFFTWLAAIASATFAYWLLEDEASDRELWLVACAWLLGFWLASGIRSTNSPHDAAEEWDEEDEEEEEWDEEDEEEWDEEDEEEWDEDDENA
jgi:hypothetical protein